MKRLSMLIILLLLLPCCALGETLRVHQDTGAEDRVKLRESPGGRVIGQYYNDVLAVPMQQKNGWTQISIGGRTGWMMSKFLLTADAEWLAENEWRRQGMLGTIWTDDGGLLSVYPEPDAQSTALLYLFSGDVDVLGTVNDDWLHIRCTSSDGSVTYGFASAWRITYADNMAGADVDTGDASQRLNLRAGPSSSARKIAELYSGTRVLFLFDNHTNGDGWRKVRVGELTGYVKDDYLNFSSAGVLAFEPPLGMLADGRSVQVLAVMGDELLVKPLGSWNTQLTSRSSISRYTPKSASTAAVTTGAVWLTDSRGEPLYALPAGHSVHIYGSRSSVTGLSTYGCIHPEDTLLYVDIVIPGSSAWTSGYLPAEYVAYNPLLKAPAPWTR